MKLFSSLCVRQILLGTLGLMVLGQQAQAELYIAGQVGANIPSDLSSTKWTYGNSTAGGNSVSQQTSMMYGAKLGYYFDSVKWLGVETEVFNATPKIESQRYTVGSTSIGQLAGANHRVLMWAPANIVVRYQAGAFEPYAGIGLGVFFSQISAANSSSSATDIGLNTQLGLRYLLMDHVALFGEWKFNYAKLSHENIGGSLLGVSADYNAHILAFGIAYHF